MNLSSILRLTLACSAALFGASANAHPVAWKGAWGIQAFTDPDSFDLQVSNTFGRFAAFAAEYQRTSMLGATREAAFPRLNIRTNRWNGLDYQGNIYLSAGYGVQWLESRSVGALFLGGEADFETRDVYFSGKSYAILSSGLPDITCHQLRAGFAPYRGNFEDLSTWFVLQAQYFPTAMSDKFYIGPVMRFYIRNVLWEAGVNTQSRWTFNLMVHF